MNSVFSKYHYFSWKIFWKIVFNPFQMVSNLLEQEKIIEDVIRGKSIVVIGEYNYVRQDVYEIDPVPILEVYEAMKPKEK